MSEQFPAGTPGTEYHWWITIQTPAGRVVTHDGVHTVAVRDTRANLFKQIVDGVAQRLGADGRDVIVMAFDVMPNALPGGAQ